MEEEKKDESTTYRLRDMLVREVSMVDHAANRRRWLMIKRSDDMPIGAEVVQNEDGTLTARPLEPEAAPEQVEMAEETVSEPVSEETGDVAEKQEAALTEDAKKVLMQALEMVQAKLAESAKMVEAAAVVETEAEMQAGDLVAMLVGCADMLHDVSMAILPPAPPAEEEGEPVAAAAPSEMGDRFEVLRAERTIRDVEAKKYADDLIAKYGSKMSKERLARFQQAIAVLGDILKELTEEKTRQAQSEQVVQAEKRATSEVQDLKKQLKALHEELGKAREARDESNAVPIEKTDESHFVWPLDMNKPLDRENVAKEEYFGGEG